MQMNRRVEQYTASRVELPLPLTMCATRFFSFDRQYACIHFYRRFLRHLHAIKSPLFYIPIKSFPLSNQLLAVSLLSSYNGHRSSIGSAYEYVRHGSSLSKQRRRPISRERWPKDLPPLSNIHDIFDDLVGNSQRHNSESDRSVFHDILEKLGGRKLRIATACSGSESPVAALEMISERLERQFGKRLEYEHCFSAENVKWKREIIKRNFNPQVLFCDVEDLAGTEGETDDGLMEPIPENIHVLIAGWVCKDYSPHNQKEASKKVGGVSDTTIEAILAHAQRYRPRIILLENVVGAPWEQMKSKWEANGYAADYVKVVSSEYYIPQVRPRRYMICVDQERFPDAPTTVEQWSSEMNRLKRPASSPFDAFLIPTKSTLPLPKGRRSERQIQSKSNQAEKRKYGLLWKARTLSYRDEKGFDALDFVFGSKKFDTNKLRRHYRLPPELTDREVEHYDIFYQRSVDRGTIPGLIEQPWQLEMCPKRRSDAISPGLIYTLLPNTKIWLSRSHRFMSAKEHLALTGFPLERLNLTGYSDSRIKDLAGNAMTTTVIGAAILSALKAAYEVLE